MFSDDALIALVEFAHKEIWKRNHPPNASAGTGTGTGVGSKVTPQSQPQPQPQLHDKRKSSPSVLGSAVSNKIQTQTQTSSGISNKGVVTTQPQRRPRSKSGGSESALLGREYVQSAPVPMQMGPPYVSSMDEYPENSSYTNRSVNSYREDECASNDSGRVRPVEKMLGLTPGYLRKPSPASSPAHFMQGTHVTRGVNSRSSPWLVFDPPLNQGSQSPARLGSQSPHTYMGRMSSPTRHSPSRPFSSTSPICIGSSSETGTGTGNSEGPIRLPAKKVTCVPVTLFSPEEHGEKRRKGDYFTHGRYEDDDSHSFVSVTSSVGSGMDKDFITNRTLQQQLQSLIISPRTAFDDISVSSSEGSNSIRKGGGLGYIKPPVQVTGKQKR